MLTRQKGQRNEIKGSLAHKRICLFFISFDGCLEQQFPRTECMKPYDLFSQAQGFERLNSLELLLMSSNVSFSRVKIAPHLKTEKPLAANCVENVFFVHFSFRSRCFFCLLWAISLLNIKNRDTTGKQDSKWNYSFTQIFKTKSFSSSSWHVTLNSEFAIHRGGKPSSLCTLVFPPFWHVDCWLLCYAASWCGTKPTQINKQIGQFLWKSNLGEWSSSWKYRSHLFSSRKGASRYCETWTEILALFARGFLLNMLYT